MENKAKKVAPTSIVFDQELLSRVRQRVLDVKKYGGKETFQGAVHAGLELWLLSTCVPAPSRTNTPLVVPPPERENNQEQPGGQEVSDALAVSRVLNSGNGLAIRLVQASLDAARVVIGAQSKSGVNPPATNSTAKVGKLLRPKRDPHA